MKKYIVAGIILIIALVVLVLPSETNEMTKHYKSNELDKMMNQLGFKVKNLSYIPDNLELGGSYIHQTDDRRLGEMAYYDEDGHINLSILVQEVLDEDFLEKYMSETEKEGRQWNEEKRDEDVIYWSSDKSLRSVILLERNVFYIFETYDLDVEELVEIAKSLD